jgi:hypothetical protein
MLSDACPKCLREPRRSPGELGKSCHAARERARRAAKRVQPRRFFRPLNARRYLITAAQNATPVHAPFFAALQRAAQHLGAELVVIPLRYKNPTSLAAPRDQEWWAPSVVPYLFNARKKLCENLVLVGDVKTQPTASSPLSGFESLTGAESCIIGHPKMQFRSVPVPTGRFPKVLTTTGVCTAANYTDTRAGKLGEFHHFLGAVLVEIDGRKFHLRQLNADKRDGSFIDLDTLYTATGVRRAPPALGLVMGDTHTRFICPQVDRATFGEGGIIETLDAQTLVFHDLIDGYATNPHHLGDPFIAQAKRRGGLGSVREEVEHVAAFLQARVGKRQAIVVSSNHDNFLARWIARTDWRQDPGNAEFYLATAQAMLASAKLTPRGAEYVDPFEHWMKQLAGANVRCLRLDESFKLADIECSLHGHQGPNGARGSLRNLSRLGARVISGHSHTPGIQEGHYQVGTSTPLRLEYTHGPSSWLNTHCVVYANGKRALITIIDGEWRLPPVAAQRRAA